MYKDNNNNNDYNNNKMNNLQIVASIKNNIINNYGTNHNYYNNNKQSMVLNLPPEILGKIFLLTSLQTRARVISKVCKFLNYFIFNHDILWSKLNLNLVKNISDSSIAIIFQSNLPFDTRIYIKELYLNEVPITIESVKIVLETCVNLKVLHLRTVEGVLEMKSVKQLLEALFFVVDENEKKSEQVDQNDDVEKGIEEGEGEEREEPEQQQRQQQSEILEILNATVNEEEINQINRAVNIEVSTTGDRIAVNENESQENDDNDNNIVDNNGNNSEGTSEISNNDDGKTESQINRVDHLCKLQTIYWYLDHDKWTWWTKTDKIDLENTLKRISKNSRASVQVPWCDFCNKQPASFQIRCVGNSHPRNNNYNNNNSNNNNVFIDNSNSNNWFYYGCFECTDSGNLPDYKCKDCIMSQNREAETAHQPPIQTAEIYQHYLQISQQEIQQLPERSRIRHGILQPQDGNEHGVDGINSLATNINIGENVNIGERNLNMLLGRNVDDDNDDNDDVAAINVMPSFSTQQQQEEEEVSNRNIIGNGNGNGVDIIQPPHGSRAADDENENVDRNIIVQTDEDGYVVIIGLRNRNITNEEHNSNNGNNDDSTMQQQNQEEISEQISTQVSGVIENVRDATEVTVIPNNSSNNDNDNDSNNNNINNNNQVEMPLL